MIHDFKEKLAFGQNGEKVIEEYFESQGYATAPGNQAAGYDLMISKGGCTQRVEAKTDFLCQKYGNLIFETISVEKDGVIMKDGWAKTSEADYLAWLLFHKRELWIFDFDDIRRLLPEWERKFPRTRPIPNDGYNTHGIKVPLAILRPLASVRNVPCEIIEKWMP